ncbi:MAG: hypothetical protein R6X35_08450, partial [Candidatus Krumholzibacteriia bacterium]
MSFAEAGAFAAAALAVTLLWWGLALAGRGVARGLRLRLAQPELGHHVLGLAALYMTAWLLSGVGLFRPAVLGVLVLGAGLAGAPAGAARLGRALRLRLPPPLLAVAAAAVFLAVVVLTATPVFHYDLTANYLGVARQYLLQGHLGPLPHDVHSGAPPLLHVLLAVLLALGEPLRTWGPILSDGHVYAVFLLSVLVLTARRLHRLAQLLTVRAKDALPVAGFAFLLWVAMPQTMLLYALKSAELITTWLALTAAAWALEPGRRRGDSAALGVLLGLMLAAKLQLAPMAAAVALVAVAQRPRHVFALGAGLIGALLPSVVRSVVVYGSPVYPFLAPDGPAGRSAALLLAENASQPTWHPMVILRRLAAILTLQPETGITAALTLPAALARPRRLGAALLVLLPAVAVAAASGAVVNGLRWLQPVLPLALVLAGAALARIDRRLVSWGGGVAAVLSLLLASQLTGSLLGLTRHLRLSPPAWTASLDPVLPLRLGLA